MNLRNFLPIVFSLLLVSINSKAQWQPQGSGLLPDNYTVISISAVNENVVWAVAFDETFSNFLPKILRTLDGGDHWEVKDVEEASGRFSLDIFGINDNIAWLTTYNFNNNSERMYKTTDGGDVWQLITQVPGSGWEVLFFDEMNGVCQAAPAIATTANGGETWATVLPGNKPAPWPNEGAVSSAGNNNLTAVGDTAWFGTTKRIYRSTDKGQHWEAFDPPAEAFDIHSLSFRDALHGMAISTSEQAVLLDQVVVLGTSDGGATWELLPEPPFYHLSCINYVPGTENTYVGVSGASGSQRISVLTTDGGLSWKIIDNRGYNAVSFLNPSLGWAGKEMKTGDAAIYKWTNPLTRETIFVKQDASGANDGTSWEDAFTNLQDALAAATFNDQIWVAAGTYLPGDAAANPDSTWFYLKPGVEMYGGFAGTETLLSERDFENNPTILSGDLHGDDLPGDFNTNREDNCTHVVFADTMISNATILDGFTIAGGHTDVNPQQDDQSTVGGGIIAIGAPVVRNCVFRHNFASSGGAICTYFEHAAGIRIENCLFEDNLAGFWGGALGAGPIPEVILKNCRFIANYSLEHSGGAVAVRDGKANFSNCHFAGNTAPWGGAAVFYAGPFYLGGEEPLDITMDSCTFENNIASTSGGAIYNMNFSEKDDFKITITNSLFSENEAVYFGAIGSQNSYTGYDLATDFQFLAESCIFENNFAGVIAGGIGFLGLVDTAKMQTTISNCQFTGNATSTGTMSNKGGAIHFEGYVLGTVGQSTFMDNHSDFGGGINVVTLPETYSLDSAAFVEITGCHFENNVAEVSVGAVFFSWQASGKIEQCTFKNNYAGSGGGVGFAGAPDDEIEPTLEINASIFEGNSSDESGGGIGIGYNGSNPVIISNCLFYDNTGPDAGIGLIGDSHDPASALSINNTIVNNESGIGLTDNSTITLQNTILSNPLNYTFSGASEVISLGGNLVSDDVLAAFLTALGDQHDTDPLLDVNFQPTENSPAIDAGIVPDEVPESDLAGNPRLQGGCIDIGAIESPFNAGTGCLTAAREVLVDEQALTVFPNPATATLFLQLDNDWNGPLTIRIVDVLGRTAKRVETVKNVGLWELSVNVEDLQTGIYQVLVSDGERMAIRKWVRM